MKKTVVLTVALMMAMTGFAWAGTDAGYKEIGVNGSFVNTTYSDNDDERNTASVGLIFNYYFSAYFSVGINYRLTGSRSEPETGASTESTSQLINLRTDLLLGGPTKSVIPYIGVHGGNSSYYSKTGDNDYDSSEFAYGLQGGLKMFPSERVSVNVELDYTTTERDTGFGDDTFEENEMSVLFGASFYF
jgi:opacity protein-like surface antigen